LLAGSCLAVLDGCDPPTEICDLGCPEDGIAQGNASISGLASIDAFFGAVISVRDAAANANASMRAELEGMAASLEIEGAAELSMDELSARISSELQAKFEVYVDGGLTVRFQEPRCQANMEVVAAAAAECDVEAAPGSVEVECAGSCEIGLEAQAQCSAEGNLSCTGQAPQFDCSGGTCSGNCEADVAFECEGSCSGTCQGTCTACAGGECETDQDGFVTNCAGSCEGECDGSCELEAGGHCDFRCEGSCEYTPPEGVECEAGATATCDVSASAEVECEGKCEGEVSPPEVSAECKASVEAKASAEIECTPPSLSIEFQFSANLSADERAEFRVWLEGFKARFAGMLAVNAKLEFIGEAMVDLTAAAGGSVRAVIEEMDADELSIQAVVGIGCAATQLEQVGPALQGAGGDVAASVAAFAEVSAAVAP
jgi:hypothetical protein